MKLHEKSPGNFWFPLNFPVATLPVFFLVIQKVTLGLFQDDSGFPQITSEK